MPRYLQSFYRPINPSKYKGNPTNIVYRSSWELTCMRKFDTSSSILEWQSEEIIVYYRSPLDPIGRRPRRYFPDFLIKKKNKDGTTSTIMIEVKPSAQCRPPVKKANSKRYLAEQAKYLVNEAKWEAAKAYCRNKGWEFLILTEKDIPGAA